MLFKSNVKLWCSVCGTHSTVLSAQIDEKNKNIEAWQIVTGSYQKKKSVFNRRFLMRT